MSRLFMMFCMAGVLALYAEGWDCGEWRPFSEMRQDCIKLVDDSRKTKVLQGDSDGNDA